MSIRLDPKVRRKQLLCNAVALATEKGFEAVTREAVADRAGVAPGLVANYLGTMTQLRRNIMRAAVKHEILSVVAYGLATNNPYTAKASPELKARTLAYLGDK